MAVVPVNYGMMPPSHLRSRDVRCLEMKYIVNVHYLIFHDLFSRLFIAAGAVIQHHLLVGIYVFICFGLSPQFQFSRLWANAFPSDTFKALSENLKDSLTCLQTVKTKANTKPVLVTAHSQGYQDVLGL